MSKHKRVLFYLQKIEENTIKNVAVSLCDRQQFHGDFFVVKVQIKGKMFHAGTVNWWEQTFGENNCTDIIYIKTKSTVYSKGGWCG